MTRSEERRTLAAQVEEGLRQILPGIAAAVDLTNYDMQLRVAFQTGEPPRRMGLISPRDYDIMARSAPEWIHMIVETLRHRGLA